MSDEIIEAEYEMITQAPAGTPEIVPFGLEGSVIPGVKAEDKNAPWRPMLFLGGPLDGQHIRMPADGRLHDAGIDVEFKDGVQYDIIHRYVPSMVTFDGRRMMVYVYLRHIRDYHSKCIEGEQARRNSERIEVGRGRLGTAQRRLGMS